MRLFKASGRTGRDADWYVNLDQIVGARVKDVGTVRGHGGECGLATEVRLFTPIPDARGEALVVNVYGEEAEAIIEALESHLAERRAA